MSQPELHGSSDGAEVIRWATFRIADERYGVDVMQVREVLRYAEITPVPGTRRSVLGIINLRGNVVTVLDARSLFDLDSHEISEKTRIVIVEALEQVVGILVDSVEDVVDIETNSIEPTPNLGKEHVRHFFQGVSHKQGELLILMDVGQMIESQMPDSQKELAAG